MNNLQRNLGTWKDATVYTHFIEEGTRGSDNYKITYLTEEEVEEQFGVCSVCGFEIDEFGCGCPTEEDLDQPEFIQEDPSDSSVGNYFGRISHKNDWSDCDQQCQR